MPFQEQAAQVAIGMAAEMEARHGFLAGVAALLVRHTVVLVEAHFLHQRLLVDLRPAAGPAGEDTGGFPLVVGGSAGTFEGEFLEGVRDLASRPGKEPRKGVRPVGSLGLSASRWPADAA